MQFVGHKQKAIHERVETLTRTLVKWSIWLLTTGKALTSGRVAQSPGGPSLSIWLSARPRSSQRTPRTQRAPGRRATRICAPPPTGRLCGTPGARGFGKGRLARQPNGGGGVDRVRGGPTLHGGPDRVFGSNSWVSTQLRLGG
jgi:hypothetical protein